jgi:3-oxoacyl-[acyl-carrier-protein] synthase III
LALLTVDGVGTYLPDTAISLESLARRGELPGSQARLFQKYYGLGQILVDAKADYPQLLLAAAERLGCLRGQEDTVRYLLCCRTLPFGSTGVLDDLRVRLGLRHATALAVTEHGCASGLLALNMAGQLLGRLGEPGAAALILAGEKAFTQGLHFIPNNTVMSEGSAAVLVRLAGSGDRQLGYAATTYPRYRYPPELSRQASAEFGQAYPGALRQVILEAAAGAGTALSGIGLLLPHNVNRISWLRVCQLAGYPAGQVYLDNIARTAHCFCADPFINLVSAVGQGRLAPGQRYLSAAAGLTPAGAVFAAMVFERGRSESAAQ